VPMHGVCEDRGGNHGGKGEDEGNLLSLAGVMNFH
jgi:hypothetical protein